jgi:hypothetical protein
MTRTLHAGAWYADALPSGEWVALYPHDKCETHAGDVPLPPGEPFGPRFVRCTAWGGFRFAGQADAGGAWEWQNGWRKIDAPCVGTSPVIYDDIGILHLSDGSIGSQGWRYVERDGTPEGHLFTGDATYRREVAPGVNLYEYSDVGGLLIGQGQDGGAVVWDGAWVPPDPAQPKGIMRLLEPGDARFIRATADGDRVAIAMMKSDGAIIVQTTLAELRALPPFITSEQPKKPEQPKPEPVPMSIPNQLGVVQRVRAKYPTPLGAQHGTFLIEVAQMTGGKLFRKDGGDHTTLPNGINVSLDILIIDSVSPPWWVDILGDAEVAAVPAWDAHPNAGEPEKFYDVSSLVLPVPSQPPAQPPSAPPQQPPATPVDLGPFLARLTAAEASVDALGALVLKLTESVDALKNAPPKKYRATGRTSQDYYHSHSINVTLDEIK